MPVWYKCVCRTPTRASACLHMHGPIHLLTHCHHTIMWYFLVRLSGYCCVRLTYYWPNKLFRYIRSDHRHYNSNLCNNIVYMTIKCHIWHLKYLCSKTKWETPIKASPCWLHVFICSYNRIWWLNNTGNPSLCSYDHGPIVASFVVVILPVIVSFWISFSFCIGLVHILLV